MNKGKQIMQYVLCDKKTKATRISHLVETLRPRIAVIVHERSKANGQKFHF